MATIMVGSARLDEYGKIAGGKAGDQTGKEVSQQSFYIHSKGWYCLRPKDPKHADKIAEAMKQACNNDNIGYDQNQRLGIVTNVKKYGSIKKIPVKTEADCGTTVRACIFQATGCDVGNFTTYNEPTVLEGSGLFEKKFVVTSSTQVYNGDVLVTKKKGHTVVVTSGRPRSSKEGVAYMFEVKTVKKGSKGTSVSLLQKLLKGLGYKGKNGKVLAIDGDAGTNTEYAINKYQEARRKEGVELGTNGKNDGSCGPKMWKDILGV